MLQRLVFGLAAVLPGESKLSVPNCKATEANYRPHNPEDDSDGICSVVGRSI